MTGSGLFPLALGLALASVMTAVTWWAIRDVEAREPRPVLRRGWQVALVAGLVSPLVLEAATVGVRRATTHYAGPDLLSESAVEVAETTSRWWVPGLTRTRDLRRSQEGRLLSETRVDDLGIPVLFLLVLAGWVLRRRGLVRRGSAPASASGPGALAAGALVLLCGVAATGCTGSDETGPGIAETRLLQLLDARATGDVTGLEAVAHPVIIYEDLPNRSQYRGIQEVAAFLAQDRQWATGIFLDLQEVRSGDDWAAVEWTLEGAQGAPIPGVADSVSFRRFQLQGVTLIELEQDLIVRAVDYADMVPLFLDLGGVLRLPNGDSLVGASPDARGGDLP